MNIEALKVELDTYGLVIVPGLISREEAETAAGRLTEVMSGRPDAGELDQHLPNPFDFLSPEDYCLFAKLLTHPVCMELGRHLLGKGFQLTPPGARWRKPGCGPRPMHMSKPLDHFAESGLPIPSTCFLATFSWNLSDVDAGTGATFYLPFSHLSPLSPAPDMDRKYAVPGSGPAGTLVFHHGGVWHGFGPNLDSRRARIGFMAAYCASWYNLPAGGYQLMSRNVRDRMPPAIQELNIRVAED